jgi:hypothetical protein
MPAELDPAGRAPQGPVLLSGSARRPRSRSPLRRRLPRAAFWSMTTPYSPGGDHGPGGAGQRTNSCATRRPSKRWLTARAAPVVPGGHPRHASNPRFTELARALRETSTPPSQAQGPRRPLRRRRPTRRLLAPEERTHSCRAAPRPSTYTRKSSARSPRSDRTQIATQLGVSSSSLALSARRRGEATLPPLPPRSPTACAPSPCPPGPTSARRIPAGAAGTAPSLRVPEDRQGPALGTTSEPTSSGR